MLNNLFNTKNHFVDSLFDMCGNKLTDRIFEQACSEYGISEDEGMEKLINSSEYEFTRNYDGWWDINIR